MPEQDTGGTIEGGSLWLWCNGACVMQYDKLPRGGDVGAAS